MSDLTIQKKELYRKLNPETTALMIVDMQNDFVKDEGYVGKRNHNIGVVQDSIEPIRKLLDYFRKKGMMVLYTETVHTRLTNSMNWVSRSVEKKRDPMICKKGTWGAQTIDELKPLESEPVVAKHRYDAFLDTELHVILRSNNIDSLVMVGTQTNLCVDSTARHAYMLDYLTIIASDGATTPELEFQEPMLGNFNKNFGYVMTSGEIIKELEK